MRETRGRRARRGHARRLSPRRRGRLRGGRDDLQGRRVGGLRETPRPVPPPVGAGVRAGPLPGVRLGRAVRRPRGLPLRRAGAQAEAGHGGEGAL